MNFYSKSRRSGRLENEVSDSGLYLKLKESQFGVTVMVAGNHLSRALRFSLILWKRWCLGPVTISIKIRIVKILYN